RNSRLLSPSSISELKPCHDRRRPRRGSWKTRRAGSSGVGIAPTDGRGADVSETASGEAVLVLGLRGERVGKRRHVHPHAIKDVCEFGPKHKAGSFADPESTSETDVLGGPALHPEVAIMG